MTPEENEIDDSLFVDDSPAPAEEPEESKKEETVEELKARVRDVERDRDNFKGRFEEEKKGKDYWYEHSKGALAAKAEPAAKPAQDAADKAIEDLDIDLTEVVTDPKGFQKLVKLLQENGVTVSAKEVQSKIDEKYNQATREGREAEELAQKYPDIRDGESEFTKSVAVEMGELQKNSGYAKLNHVQLAEIAADRVELRLQREGKKPAGGSSEAERAARISRQQGGGGRGRQPSKETVNEELSEDQKLICRRLGVTEAEYKKNAREGIRVVRRVSA